MRVVAHLHSLPHMAALTVTQEFASMSRSELYDCHRLRIDYTHPNSIYHVIPHASQVPTVPSTSLVRLHRYELDIWARLGDVIELQQTGAIVEAIGTHEVLEHEIRFWIFIPYSNARLLLVDTIQRFILAALNRLPPDCLTPRLPPNISNAQGIHRLLRQPRLPYLGLVFRGHSPEPDLGIVFAHAAIFTLTLALSGNHVWISQRTRVRSHAIID